jgi:TonB-dependent receptor
MHRHNTVAVAVAAILASAMQARQAAAQDTSATEDLQEVVVTGLRASLTNAMDIKRDAIGIVDAINAEDIGKFPDANLSESLQRITGISISRRNGEGALVTARGFGSEFNMVTLNGRMMPAADAFAGGNTLDGGVSGQNRSFNFANLASESISAIEVYKTGKADIATGGIGATVNVVTARPLDSASRVASFGVKAVNDVTNRTGDDITPEVSGIFSFANDDKTWGIGLSGSYQKRDSGSSMSTINDWNIRTWQPTLEGVDDTTALSRDGANNINAVIENAPAPGQLYGIPNDIRYHFADRERERTNAQLTFQFRPVETLTLTADYTFAENDLIEDRGDQTTWMNANRFRRIVFDTGNTVATPLLLEEDEGTSKDFGFEQQHREQKNELNSVGFNAGWNVTDRFNLSFDFHDSKAESLPDDPVTGGGETLMSFAARVPSTCTVPDGSDCTNRFVQQFMFNSGLPISKRILFPETTAAAPTSGGNENYAFTTNDLGSQVLRVNFQEQITDIQQTRLDGGLDMADGFSLGMGALKFNEGRLQFGVETRAMESRQRGSNAQMTLGNWGVASPGEIPANLLTPFAITQEFEDFNTAGAPTNGWKGNANALAQWAVDAYGTWRDPLNTPGVLGYNPGFTDHHTIKEDTQSAYLAFGMKGDLGSMPLNILAGVRYEKTDVDADSTLFRPTALQWQDNNDFSVLTSAIETIDTSASGDYDNVLPSLDIDLSIRDNLKARFAFSKTIARAQYNDLRAAVTPAGQNGSTLNGFSPNARGSNTGLVPLESENLDISLEWYFGPSSYAAIGAFRKDVKNFIGNQVVQEEVYGIRDATAGPRALQAVQELQARGFGTDDTNLFVMIAMIEHANDAVNPTGGAAAFNGTEAQHVDIATRYDIEPILEGPLQDPVAQFNVTRATNNRDAVIDGLELAGQHFFGNSGVGIQLNYTIVNGDVAFDNGLDPSQNQFALVGLSDSANAVLMYEKYNITARLAWNWRDEYLANANIGNNRNPLYVEAYDQIDVSVGYDFNDNLALSFEVLNLTEEDVRWHGRSDNQVWFVEDQGARYSLGARYKF